MGLVSWVGFSVFCALVHALSAEEDVITHHTKCPNSFNCGKLGNLTFPFTSSENPLCGFFTVSDCDAPLHTIQLQSGGRWLNVENISQPDTILINDTSLEKNLLSKSCEYFDDTAFLWSVPYFSFHIDHNFTIFKCNRNFSISFPPNENIVPVRCLSHDYDFYYSSHQHDDLSSLVTPPHCSTIQLPAKTGASKGDDLFQLLSHTFRLQVHIDQNCIECYYRGGFCQTDTSGSFYCYRAKDKDNLALKLALVISGAGVGLVMILVFLFRRKYSLLLLHPPTNSLVFWKKKTDNFNNIEAFLQEFGTLSPKRFSYSDIKKITNVFRDKLGEGGFGGVYKGKLQDGRLVAVKVLKGSKGDGEDFINEVSSISRTSHINIVTLLGFCFEGDKRALVYEFMANGSLEKFIYEKSSVNAERQLKWEILYQISVGIARGLEYLHRGCNTRILHFDIKPHNILLDDDFCPKISDFGLAKICPRKESIVSMLGARGTPGYIAPEVFCRNFGGVSHKSDVYSYGMMVLEMVGGRRNIDVGADHTSEIYFPHWIYKRLEVNEELGLQGIVNEVDKDCAKKMILVSLWCIQTDPFTRPPMTRVVEMLEGSVASLQKPPNPLLSSPSRSPNNSTTIQSL